MNRALTLETHFDRSQSLIDYWNDLRGEKPFPCKKEIRMADLPVRVAHVWFVAVPEPDNKGVRDYEYTLFSSLFESILKVKVQGRFASELTEFPAGFISSWSDEYDKLLGARVPHVKRNKFEYATHVGGEYETVFLPLGGDGKISHIMCYMNHRDGHQAFVNAVSDLYQSLL